MFVIEQVLQLRRHGHGSERTDVGPAGVALGQSVEQMAERRQRQSQHLTARLARLKSGMSTDLRELDGDGDGVQDASEDGVAGAVVTLFAVGALFDALEAHFQVPRLALEDVVSNPSDGTKILWCLVP